MSLAPDIEYELPRFLNYLWRFEFDDQSRIDKIRHYSGACLNTSYDGTFELEPCKDTNVFFDMFTNTIGNSVALWVANSPRDIITETFFSDDRLRHYLQGYAHENLQFEYIKSPEDFFHETERERHCYWYGSECSRLWDIGALYYPIRVHIKASNGHY